MNEAARPAFLLVDEEREALDALWRALKRRLGADYQIVAETQPERGLSVLQQLRERDKPVAVIIAAQRMQHMAGEQFLERAHELYPLAGRALVCAAFDRSAEQSILHAMALGRADMILVRPWDPADHRLYPRIGMLLDRWVQATEQPGVCAMRVVMEPDAPYAHRLRDELYRNAVPFQCFPPDSPRGRQLLELARQDGTQLPVCVYFDGRVQVDPSVPEIAEALGLRSRPDARHYDVTVIGAGPAGLSAALSSASEGLHTLVVESETVGGQAATTSMIRNYLGFPWGVSGKALMEWVPIHAVQFGAEMVFDRATGLGARGGQQLITLAGGSRVTSDAVVISIGVQYRRLSAPGVEGLIGAGVFYGASLCEVPATRGRTVYIVGGGNSAGQAAVYLARYAEHVTIVVRRGSLSATMSSYLIDQIGELPNVNIRPNTEVTRAGGAGRLEQLTLYDSATGRTEDVEASALFILAGAQPRTDWLPDTLARDDAGFLLTGPDLVPAGGLPNGWSLARPPLPMETSVAAVFAAGDVRHGSTKRVAVAVGEGASAVQSAHRHFQQLADTRQSVRPL
ncbi:MAG TPA: FAD-dependent oxidoreductase [Streptosporangiaceae bacterium]|nr:FAD-dependent oxidoreductase [Streptosporangiaceae bacterium]